MPRRFLAVLAVSLFLFTLLARAPARWALAAAPAGIECAMPSGSIWQGACAQVRAPGIALDGLGWRLHAWPLLRGHLDLDLQSADARAPGSARLSISAGGHLALRDLRVELPVGSEFLPLFPTGWTGRLQLDFTRVELERGGLDALVGKVTALALAQRRPAMAFGSFELGFDAAAPTDGVIAGSLRDLGGPLAVSGTLRLRNGGEYELNGLATARPGASPELAKAVEFLGASDAQGRRPFSLAGTF